MNFDVRMFPRGNFPEDFSQKEVSQKVSFPEGKFPRRSVSQKEVSQKVSFPEGQFPRR